MEPESSGARPGRMYRVGPRTLTRRHVVGGALGLTGVAATGTGLARLDADMVRAQEATVDFSEPPVCRSVDGVLETILIAQEQASTVPGSRMNFNGIVPGPTLRLRQGERLRIKLVNRLPKREDPMDTGSETNLHVHGLHVSPLGHGDDVLRTILPGDKWVYEYDIRPDHQAGLFWYHPHRHHNVLAQVSAGMAGAIIVEGDLDELPQTKGVPERLLVLQSNFAPGSTSGVVNGLTNPTMRISEGEIQRWRILNASSSTFFNLELEGHTLRRISVDGNYLRNIVETDVLLLGPAERAEVLIEAKAPGTFAFRSLEWDGPPHQDPFTLATLISEPIRTAARAEATPARSLETNLIGDTVLPDLRAAAAPVEREITFMTGNKIRHMAGDSPMHFDPMRVDQWVKLGATEKWVIRNHTLTHWHPFHLHVNDLQVVNSNGEVQLEPFVFYKDTVPVPPMKDGNDGRVELLIPFLHFTGRFVYHCHILDHEDLGMMGVVDVMQPIDIVGSTFNPATIEVAANTTVQWTNLDGYAHTVTADNGDFDSGPLNQGDEYRWRFSEAGTFSYHCEYHPKMRGTILVPEVIEPAGPLEVPIDIVASAFNPDSIEIAACQTVQWTNRDAIPHTINADDGTFDSGLLNTGDTFPRTFYQPGTYTYHLAGRPDRVGTVVVT